MRIINEDLKVDPAIWKGGGGSNRWKSIRVTKYSEFIEKQRLLERFPCVKLNKHLFRHYVFQHKQHVVGLHKGAHNGNIETPCSNTSRFG